MTTKFNICRYTFTLNIILFLYYNICIVFPLFFMILLIYAGLGMMFIVGFFLFIVGCLCGTAQLNQKKYIVSATPIFCFAIVFIPLVILISFKEGVDHIPDILITIFLLSFCLFLYNSL